MDYYQVVCPDLSDTENEILIAELSGLGFESFEETEDAILAYIPANKFSKKILEEVGVCKKLLKKGLLKTNLIPDQNWNALWESNYPPVIIKNTIYVHAPFHEEKPGIKYNILVKPKMAFGTAHHETTFQVLEMMLDEDFKDKEVLDMGCGTGVFAILAAMMGARHVDAVDNDPWAYNNSLENVELNNKNTIIDVYLGDASWLKFKNRYDVIFANINKNILLRDMPFYVPSLKSNGLIFFSGFYERDLEDIKNKAISLGLEYVKHQTKNDWVAAKFVKME